MANRSRFSRDLLALATPLLVLLGLVGVALRQGSDRLQAVPALVIGVALLLQSAWSWRRRRRALLEALRDNRGEC
ncbi:DUF3188 domain-containing protein [Synechococcus sp. CBW1107]|jgi:hypothetical protein|uniref:DUF3188 domain-containing protein n=1 Tax=Synechococcus sp. CBW1107 TaxID=2789857 RepID=UPI002AD46A56|nr:DUF3188 domain-containing protein [Synechococcus sp. CBW1107]CAK6697805.1 hypothetical protein MNNICLKF_02320 [Synechococcus sp. CBW1107]